MNNTQQIYKIQRWIPTEWIEMTNHIIDDAVVNEIVKNFDGELFGALPGIFHAGKFRITDGNHRTTAFRRMGKKYIPIIILTDEEYLAIAYSENTLDFIVKRSMDVITPYPKAICTKLQHV